MEHSGCGGGVGRFGLWKTTADQPLPVLMLAAMSNQIAPRRRPHLAPSRSQAPPGGRLAGWLLVPFALVVALAVCAVLSGCAAASVAATSEASAAPGASVAPEASPARRLCTDRVIEGIVFTECSDPAETIRDHRYSRDEQALAEASDALETGLQQIVDASTDPDALTRTGGMLTPAFAAWQRTVSADVEPERRPSGVSLHAVGLQQRQPYDGATIGSGDGAIVLVKACWTTRYPQHGLFPRERLVEAEVTLTSPGGERLRVAGWDAWEGESFCPR